MIEQALISVENLAFVSALRNSTFMYPLVNAGHILGVSLLVGSIVPLDKVELSDLGTYPLPVGAFCSSHWFDYRPGGLVAVGFYGGGTQVLDVSDPREITSHASAVWGASEVWDAMWVPVYKNGKQTQRRTNIVYAIDLLRGLDVYAVDVTGREVFVQNAEEHTHGFVAPDLGMGAHRSATILNAVTGREAYPVEKRVATQTFGVPEHLRAHPTHEPREVSA